MSPIYNRRSLRQRLGTEFIKDTVVGQTSGSWGTQAGSYNIIDSALADPTLSGETPYYRHTLRLIGSAGFLQDLRVGSFNTGSGAFLGAQTLATTILSGRPFEVHGLVTPADKDKAIDAAIQRIRIQQEVPIWAVENASHYSLGPEILDITGVRYFSDPAHSLNRGETAVAWYKHELTATGQELRISPTLLQSQQLIIDAVLAVSLGAGDLATVNLPDDTWPLWRATAQCYWGLERKAPGQETEKYRQARKDAANAWAELSRKLQPKISRDVQMPELW